MSASMPATTAIGALANIPQHSRNPSNDDQVGDKAQAMVKRAKTRNVAVVRYFLPNCSLNGAQMTGPKTYPSRKMEMGKTLSSCEREPKVPSISGIAMQGRAEPIVELATSMHVKVRM